MRNNYIKKTLKNGVKLYLYIDKKMKRTYVDYGIFYGSLGYFYDFYLNDKYYKVLPGCAHFLEHLLGEHSKYGNIYKKFSAKKYAVNATTGDKYTHYYFWGIENIFESIKELINIVDDPVFNEEDIKKTSEAICEETKRGLDNKRLVAWAICLRNLYPNMELVSDTLNRIGNEVTTRQINFDMLKACYDAYYSDDNKFLLIAGNIDEKEITDYIESIYEDITPHSNNRKEYIYSNNYEIKKDIQIEYMPTSDDYVMIGYKQKSNKDFNMKEIRYFMEFILETKFSDDSDFIEEMKKKNIISQLEDKVIQDIKDSYYFIIGVSSNKYKEFYKHLNNELKQNNFTQQDFDLFKKVLIANQAFKMDSKYQQFMSFSYRFEYSEEFDDIDFIKKLSFDCFKEFYNTLDFSKNTIAIIRNPEVK